MTETQWLYVIFVFFGLIIICVTFLSSFWLKVIRKEFDFPSLPEEFDGYRILHLSDMHFRSVRASRTYIWGEIDKLSFDAVAITGDIVLSKPEQIDAHAVHISGLAKRCRVFYVGGNHEARFCGELFSRLRKYGVTVLDNETATQEINGVGLCVIGFEDYYRLEKRGPEKAAAMVPETGFKLVLEHQPQFFDKIKDRGELLMLCGHTHGGQLRLPFLPVFYAPGQRLFPKYSFGEYRHKKAIMLISKGMGATYFPFRFYNRPEMTVITLRKH